MKISSQINNFLLFFLTNTGGEVRAKSNLKSNYLFKSQFQQINSKDTYLLQFELKSIR